ncbi:insulinase family protein [Synechococcus sp. RSCCF101]|nr:insulinase family protein [Synechococcus sp. RSCCF101]
MWLHSHQGPAILAARLWLEGGSGGDPLGARGAHQLLAACLTRGCGDRDARAMAELVEGLGAALRCDAHEDALVLSLKCASDDASTLLPLLEAMVRRPRLDPDQVDLERDLTLQMLRRNREDPFQLALEQLRPLLYESGPYGHDPLGTEPGVAASDDALLAGLAHSLPDRPAVLVIDGVVDPGLESRLTELVSLPDRPLPAASDGPPPIPGDELAGSGCSVAIAPADTEQLVLMLGRASVPLGHPDDLALRLLDCHLGAGMSSRLFQVMREERGLAYDVGVQHAPRRGASPFVMSLSTGVERGEEACACLLEEWDRMGSVPLSARELDLAVAKFRGQLAHARQTCSQRADRTALLLTHGLPLDFDDQQLEAAAHLTPEAVMASARRWLSRPMLSICGPQPEAEALLSSLPPGWNAASPAP